MADEIYESEELDGAQLSETRDSLDTVTPAVIDRSQLDAVLEAGLRSVAASYTTLQALSYAARTWVNDTSNGPWLNATNLNDMDGQIEALTDAVNTLNGNIESLRESVSQNVSTGSSVSSATVGQPSATQVISLAVSGNNGDYILFAATTYIGLWSNASSSWIWRINT